jgi:hypothetical protein
MTNCHRILNERGGHYLTVTTGFVELLAQNWGAGRVAEEDKGTARPPPRIVAASHLFWLKRSAARAARSQTRKTISRFFVLEDIVYGLAVYVERRCIRCRMDPMRAARYYQMVQTLLRQLRSRVTVLVANDGVHYGRHNSFG